MLSKVYLFDHYLDISNILKFGFRFANSTLFHNCIFKRLTDKIKKNNLYKMILDILIQYNNIFHSITRLIEEGYLFCFCRIMIY